MARTHKLYLRLEIEKVLQVFNAEVKNANIACPEAVCLRLSPFFKTLTLHTSVLASSALLFAAMLARDTSVLRLSTDSGSSSFHTVVHFGPSEVAFLPCQGQHSRQDSALVSSLTPRLAFRLASRHTPQLTP